MPNTKHTRRGWLQDRERVNEHQPYELYSFVQHHTPRGDVPERGLQKGTTKKIRAVIKEMKGGNSRKVILWKELIYELEKVGMIYHDAIDQAGQEVIDRVARNTPFDVFDIKLAYYNAKRKDYEGVIDQLAKEYPGC